MVTKGHWCLLLKYCLMSLKDLKVSDEPLGHSNTERREETSARISKKRHQVIFIFIIKSQFSDGEDGGIENQKLKFTRFI